jgi:pimeloyl-ACP methyl ester carboxylesterase
LSAIAGVAAQARWDEWRRVTAPTLLILGEHGTIPAGEIALVVPGAGHDVHLDAPETTARLVLDFLAAESR